MISILELLQQILLETDITGLWNQYFTYSYNRAGSVNTYLLVVIVETPLSIHRLYNLTNYYLVHILNSRGT